jgi:hypothetical protein
MVIVYYILLKYTFLLLIYKKKSDAPDQLSLILEPNKNKNYSN